MRPLLTLVVLSAAAAGLFAGCGDRGPAPGPGAARGLPTGFAQARARGRLVVLTEVGFPRFGTKTPDGELVGVDMDLAREVAKDLGLPLELRDRRFDLLFGELQRRVGDVVISGVTVTDERKKEVAFSSPYFLTGTYPLLARPRADGVKTVDDLDDPGRRVIAKLGTTGEHASRRRLPRARIDTLGDESLCALEVAQGRADAFVYDEIQVRLYAREHPGTTRVLEERVTVEPYAVACRLDDPETVAWLDDFLARARKDGRLDAIFRKHLPELGAAPGGR